MYLDKNIHLEMSRAHVGRIPCKIYKEAHPPGKRYLAVREHGFTVCQFFYRSPRHFLITHKSFRSEIF